MPGDETLEAYLERLASAAPTPGGGAAAALTLAQAAALLAMVCRLTRARDPEPGGPGALAACLADAEAARAGATLLARLDSEAFEGYARALNLPKDGPESMGRPAALARALEESARVPACLHELAAHVLRPGGCLRYLALAGNPRVLSDVHVARHLALAALASARENVLVNLKVCKDPALVRELEERLERSGAAALAAPEPASPNPPQNGPATVTEILQSLPERLRNPGGRA